MRPPLQTPSEIRRLGAHGVRIVWTDGHTSEYRNDYLRDHCPCAACRERPPRRLPVLNEPNDALYPVQIGLVGRYAVSIQWSDGHDTGIYSYHTLRALCPCAHCQPAARAGAGAA
jgi:DUF971 family protein